MASKFVIVTPEVAPGTGGLADHTLALLQRWGSIPNLTVLTADPTPPGTGAADTDQLGSDRAAITAQLPSEGGSVFVQYSGYGFNRLGYPHGLIGALIEWKERTSGRLVVLFHEIWTFWPVINKNFVIQQFHRHAIKRLLGACDAVFTTTASQVGHLKDLCSTAPVQILPVGSNIRRQSAVSVPREEGLAVLFGLQANRIRALEMMRESLTVLATAGQIRKIIAVGHGSDPELSAREKKLLLDINLTSGFSQEGALPEQNVSEILSRATYGIFGQSELSCTKSGSLMAYAAHQLTVISNFAEPSKAPPVCWMVTPAELLGGIPRDELDRREKCLRVWQDENASWDAIADKLARTLRIEVVQGSNRQQARRDL